MTQLVPPADAAPLDPVEPVTLQGTVSTTLTVAEREVLDLLSHAAKSGPRTTEFWAAILTPIVAFLVALLASSAAVRAIAAPPVIQAVTPVVIATLVTALATLAARAYIAARSALKSALVSHASFLTTHP